MTTETLQELQKKYPRIANLLLRLSGTTAWETYVQGIREVEREKRPRFFRLECLILDEIGVEYQEEDQRRSGVAQANRITALLEECRTLPPPEPPTVVESGGDGEVKSAGAAVKRVRRSPKTTSPKKIANVVRLKDYDWSKPIPPEMPLEVQERLKKCIAIASVADQNMSMSQFHKRNCQHWGMSPNSATAHRNMLKKWQDGSKEYKGFLLYGSIDWSKPRSGSPYDAKKKEEVDDFFKKLQGLNCPPEMRLIDIKTKHFPELSKSAFDERIRNWQVSSHRRKSLQGDRRKELIEFMLKAQADGVPRRTAIFDYAKVTGGSSDSAEKQERLIRKEGDIPNWKK